MNYEDFKQDFWDELKEVFEEKGMEVDIQEVEYDSINKSVDGMAVRIEGAEVVPTLHTNSIYERWQESDMSIREVAENVAESVQEEYEKIEELDFKLSDFNADFVRENSYLSVVNREWNQELLQNVPHEDIPGTDLSACAKVSVGEGATITLTNSHASMLQMTSSEIMDAAKENTLSQEFSVRSMEEVLKDIMPPELVEEMNLFPEMEHPNMVVITNEMRYEGANAILSKETLDAACEKLGTNDITIIPSSRHELLGVDAEALGISSTAEIKELVEEINGTQVDMEDQLSNNIYHYDSASRELEVCNEEGLFRQDVGEELTQQSGYEMNMGGM